MVNEAREHLNLAHYNFNRMEVIEEEGIENNNSAHNQSKQRKRSNNNYLVSAGQELRQIKNMHNTTSGFYPPKFGDRMPTRGDVQSRGNRINLIPSAQGTRRGNSRAENSLNRGQQKQSN
jgi:hypothetical protein